MSLAGFTLPEKKGETAYRKYTTSFEWGDKTAGSHSEAIRKN